MLKSKRTLYLTLAITVIHWVTVLTYSNYIKPTELTSSAAPKLRLIAFNAWAKPEAINELSKLAKAHNTDVIAISEMSQASCKDLTVQFPDFTFCRIAAEASNGQALTKRMALLSKIEPLRYTVLTEPGFRGRGIIDASFPLGEDNIRLISIHPVAPGSPAHMRDRDNVLRRAAELLKDEDKFILAGDMNTTPWSAIYRQLPGRRIGDARLELTWRLSWHILGLPIDHIQISENMQLHAYKVGPNIGSDHRPLIADVSVK